MGEKYMQDKQPLISVLMSVKNGLPYVRGTVESILAQTATDWEFVIVDNASTDGSAELIERIARNEPRIRLFRNPADLGHSGGLNRGLAECRGVWVARLDADDIAMPDRFERQLEFLRENSDVKVTSCLALYINTQGETVGKTYSEPATRETFQRYLRENLAFGLLHPGAMVDRELFVKIGGYRAAYDPANDTDLWGRLADAGGVILVQQEYLMKYRVHGGSITSQSFERLRTKYQWARDCMRARRKGLPEPTWEDYVAARRNAPWWKRLNRWRKTNARKFYRQSAQDLISNHTFRAAFEVFLAMLLQPSYAAPRLLGQIHR